MTVHILSFVVPFSTDSSRALGRAEMFLMRTLSPLIVIILSKTIDSVEGKKEQLPRIYNAGKDVLPEAFGQVT